MLFRLLVYLFCGPQLLPVTKWRRRSEHRDDAGGAKAPGPARHHGTALCQWTFARRVAMATKVLVTPGGLDFEVVIAAQLRIQILEVWEFEIFCIPEPFGIAANTLFVIVVFQGGLTTGWYSKLVQYDYVVV